MPHDLKLQLQSRLINKTKPPESLGKLEALALQIGLIQESLNPTATPAKLLLFAADHGVYAEGIAPYPQAVTAQMVLNICVGGAASSVLARQHQMPLTVVDVGVASKLDPHVLLIDAKVAFGSRNLAREVAMQPDELKAAMAAGASAVQLSATDARVVLIGEMGIGNTTSATALSCVLLGALAESLTGPGTGLDQAGIRLKAAVIHAAMQLHGYLPGTPFLATANNAVLKLLGALGGLEIAAMTGAYLECASMRKVILVDGMIATAALACAVLLEPTVLEFCVFSHQSSEPAHAGLLRLLGATPLLNLQLRLGEGTGALCAYPLLQSACAIINEMATFSSAGVANATAPVSH
jgi:nicotinate-nucleotide--dimethylbenzimidazole phosphoribosyltransferase